ncbi:MAG: DNA-processing protein DprA [Clostridia bacterium]|nr:DNA-processing protein DprA [Clostridia bacterium]
MSQSLIYWIWLSEAAGPATNLALRLLKAFGTIENIYQADRFAYINTGVLLDDEVKALSDKSLDHAKKILEACMKKNIGIVALDSDLYPDRLKRIQDPPAVLYYRGIFPSFDTHLALALVGTRNATDDGLRNGYRIAYELSVIGAMIVSGMAAGIDGIVQQAALDAKGTSVAVLGTAIDRCYPVENRDLYDQLILEGCVISEYAPGAKTYHWSFPQRNRIISGLCQGTLIVEASTTSGAIITAKCAASQGRDVFAIPGDSRAIAYTGNNNLIKVGAEPVTDTGDLMCHYSVLNNLAIYPEKRFNYTYYTNYNDRLKYNEDENSTSQNKSAAPTVNPACLQPDIPAIQKAKRNTVTKTDKSAANRTTALREEPIREVPISDEEIREMRTPVIDDIHNMGQAPIASAVRSASPPQKSTADRVSTPLPKEENAVSSDTRRPLEEEEKKILSLIKSQKTFDDLCRMCDSSVSQMVTKLSILEIDGYLEATPGGYYTCIE